MDQQKLRTNEETDRKYKDAVIKFEEELEVKIQNA